MTRRHSTVGSRPPTLRDAISAMDQVLVLVPQNEGDARDRIRIVRGCMQAIETYGVDSDSLLRYGMPHRAALAIYIFLIKAQPEVRVGQIDTERWAQLLQVRAQGQVSSDDENQEMVNTAQLQAQLELWVMSAPLEDVLRWTPPSDAEWGRIALESRPPLETANAYEWLWNRNVVADLDRWSIASLHLEYHWQNKGSVALFSERALRSEGPETVQLNAMIARRATEPAGVAEMDVTFWALQDAAVDYLKRGDNADAVALFRFHHRRFPQDSRAINNLGFCLFPQEPEEALHWLRVALTYGFDEKSINTYNQCCCLELLNAAGEALDLAENYWQRERPERPDTGFLWAVVGDKWTLTADRNVEELLIELAIRAAGDLGLTDRVAMWTARRESLAS